MFRKFHLRGSVHPEIEEKDVSLFRRVSMRWRLTLMTALVVTAACIVLTAIISTSATVQLDEMEAYIVEVNPGIGEELEIDLSPALLLDKFPDMVASMKYRFRMQSILAMLCVVLIASGITWWVAGRMLQPLRSLNETIDRTNARNLAKPLKVPKTRDEIAALTIAYNCMLERLNQVFVAQKRFTANAAHEFRTPLAVMRTKLDIFGKKAEHTQEEYDEMLSVFDSYTDRMRVLLDQLLEMANMQTVAMEDTVCLQDLLEEVLCDLAEVAEKKGVTLEMKAPEKAAVWQTARGEDTKGETSGKEAEMAGKSGSLPDALGETAERGSVKGNDVLLYRAFYNLVENAVKYNVPGGRAEVTVGRRGEQICVTVSDTGIGIPESVRERVFEPFYQVDPSRSKAQEGFGLGLSLVKAIIEQHGGTVAIGEGDSKGTLITVTLRGCEEE